MKRWLRWPWSGAHELEGDLLFVHHHLGLGDTFTANALVHHILRVTRCRELRLFAKECNAHNVRMLYRDQPRVHVVPLPLARDAPVGEHELARAYLRAHGARPHQYLRLGFDAMSQIDKRFGRAVSCDEAFYVQAGMPYALRFSGFRMPRDMQREEAVYKQFNPSGAPYAFIDADPARGVRLPTLDRAGEAGADASLPHLFNEPTIPLLHMGLILERATELHLCESAIRCLVEGTAVYTLQARRLFLHTFRGGIWAHNTMLQWIEVPSDGAPVQRCVPFSEAHEQHRLLATAESWYKRRCPHDPLRRAIHPKVVEAT